MHPDSPRPDFFCRWQDQFQGLLVELSRLQRQEREVVSKLLITRLLTTYEEVRLSSKSTVRNICKLSTI